MDKEIGKSNSDNDLRNPPKKLMDFHIIYSYRYYIPFNTLDQINKLLPGIKMGNGDELTKIKVSNYFPENGKIKSKRVNSKQILSEVSSNELQTRIQDCEFAANSLIEVIIEIKSYNFNSLRPSFNNKGVFERNLMLSMPEIFQYEFPDIILRCELLSEEDDPFRLLQFNREAKNWDKVIEIFETNCKTFSWKIPKDVGVLTDFSFNLKGLQIVGQGDIGVPVTDFFRVDN